MSIDVCDQRVTDRASCTGGFLDGKCHRHAAKTFTNGASYVGEWVEEYPHGQGTMIDPHGALYAGGFRYGKCHGHGARMIPGGASYVGEWVAGIRHGKGSMIDFHESIFEGLFLHNMYQLRDHGGSGCDSRQAIALGFQEFMRSCNLVSMNENVSEEEVDGSRMHYYGSGRLDVAEPDPGALPVFRSFLQPEVSANTGGLLEGNFYDGYDTRNVSSTNDSVTCDVGEFTEGICSVSGSANLNASIEGLLKCTAHGHGALHCCDFVSYDGEWDAGRFHGLGTYVRVAVIEYSGEFVEGNEKHHGKRKYLSRASYVGEWVAGFYHGQGIFEFTTDSYRVRQDGQFAKGMFEGFGTELRSATDMLETTTGLRQLAVGHCSERKNHGRVIMSTASSPPFCAVVYEDGVPTSTIPFTDRCEELSQEWDHVWHCFERHWRVDDTSAPVDDLMKGLLWKAGLDIGTVVEELQRVALDVEVRLGEVGGDVADDSAERKTIVAQRGELERQLSSAKKVQAAVANARTMFAALQVLEDVKRQQQVVATEKRSENALTTTNGKRSASRGRW